MTKPLHRFILFLLLSFVLLPSVRAAGQASAATVVVDDEYDRYKKRGDDYFKEGKYVEARRQYQNCLEVPGFENDAYAKGQLDKCTTALTLRQQADDALKQDKYYETVTFYGKLLEINPADPVTREQLATYYERDGNKLYNEQKYAYAKARYEQALPYSTRQETLRVQIRNCEENLRPIVPKRIGLKMLTGAVAIGAGAYALLLRSDFQTKQTTLNQISQTTDPSGTGIIGPRDAYRQYDEAYNAAEAAQRKNNLFKACIGVAAVATVAELYLLIHKSKPRVRAFNWHPSSTSWGLAATFTF